MNEEIRQQVLNAVATRNRGCALERWLGLKPVTPIGELIGSAIARGMPSSFAWGVMDGWDHIGRRRDDIDYTPGYNLGVEAFAMAKARGTAPP